MFGGCPFPIQEKGGTPSEQWKNPGWLGNIGMIILAIYIGIVINHDKDPY